MKRVLITDYENKLFCGLFEERKLREAVLQGKEKSVALGNIYIGKVSRIVSNINAAFVDIGTGEDCYYPLDKQQHLHCRNGRTREKLSAGDEIIVQVSQEGQKKKHPSLTSAIEFKSPDLIYTMGKKGVGISSKLSDKKKRRIRQQLEECMKACLSEEEIEEGGLLARSSAGERREEELREQAEKLIRESRQKLELWKHKKCFTCLWSAEEQYLSYLYGLSSGSYQEIVTDLPEVKEKLEEKGFSLRFYQDALLPLSKLYSVKEQIEAACREKAWMKSGAYLIIQVTEALAVIDVNTGKNVAKKSKAETLLKVNLEAAREAAEQIRLRNLSGIILIDFIDMHDKEAEEKLLTYMREAVKEDPNRVQVFGFTQLRLMEMTRKKVRKPLWEQLREQ